MRCDVKSETITTHPRARTPRGKRSSVAASAAADGRGLFVDQRLAVLAVGVALLAHADLMNVSGFAEFIRSYTLRSLY